VVTQSPLCAPIETVDGRGRQVMPFGRSAALHERHESIATADDLRSESDTCCASRITICANLSLGHGSLILTWMATVAAQGACIRTDGRLQRAPRVGDLILSTTRLSGRVGNPPFSWFYACFFPPSL